MRELSNIPPIERDKAIVEDVQDGVRFSRTIKEITNKKDLIEKAQRMRDKSAQRALEIGLIEPQDIVDGPDVETDERLANAKIQAALGIKNLDGIYLSQEDIDFINTLPNDETRDAVITELFSKRVAKKYRQMMRTVAHLQEKKSAPPSRMAVDFVKGYINEYNKLLQGLEHKSLTEIKEDAGYSASMGVTTVLNLPWIANKIEKYHQSIDKLNEYHYMQIRDRKIREHIKVQDLKDIMLNHFLSNPHELIGAKIKDKTQFLRVMNEMTQTAEGRDANNNRAPVAIQINGDVARLAMGQDKEKRDHFAQSF